METIGVIPAEDPHKATGYDTGKAAWTPAPDGPAPILIPPIPPAAEPPTVVTLPRTPDGWISLALTLAGLGWSLYDGLYPAAVMLLGLAMNQLRVNGKLQGVVTTAVMAFAGSRHAVRTTETLKEAVRDLQDNPAAPGTPGWMDRRGDHMTGPPA